MNWTDDFLLERDTPDTVLRGQVQLALYAIHLASGNNIFCKSLRCSTIEQYVLAASSFLAQFSGLDYRKDASSDIRMGHLLAPIYKEIKRYETVPNRREPYTVAMHLEARSQAAGTPSLGLLRSLADGFELGLLAGLRLTEWAQPSGHGSILTPHRHDIPTITPRTRAFVVNDFRAELSSRAQVVGLDILNHPSDTVTKIWVKFRTQKNSHHGEERLFSRNPNPDGFCFVRSAISMLNRFRAISLLDPRVSVHSTPISIYWDATARVAKLVTGDDIETFMRYIAAKVYHLDPKTSSDALSRWSSHSLRVGACVLLHAMDFQPLDIQWLLRWRSMAFMIYLRNVAVLSQRQFRAFDRATATPHLF